MQDPMQDLLQLNDPDYAAFNRGDPEFLLRSVGDTIRQYCGWHIAPSITQTVTNIEVGRAGIVMLPSLHVTDVALVALQANAGADLIPLDPTTYTWHQEGYVEPVNRANFGAVSGYWYEPSPAFLPITSSGMATVTMTHGYASLPSDLKRVAYELAGWAQALGPDGAAGDIKEIKSPGFALSLGGAVSLGMNLNPDQKARLANYKIGGAR